ncbi:MAG: hypothetical protein KDI00_07000 [Pseudomonadales bacterium]|nr:hypothetical protein [Pseudomonadales bacterium]
MKNAILILLLLGSSSVSYAEMQAMNEEELQAVDGQAGADLSLEMRLNQNPDYSFDATLCADFEFCRWALNLNNRNHDGTVTGSATGRKLWLVFKQVQGTLKFQEVKLDGADLAPYVGDNSATVLKAAVQFGFNATKPILIRNFGYQSLAIESDTCTETNLNCSTGTTNLPGYLAKASGGSGAGAYANGKYTAAGFDQGREVGFTGLSINANLALQGTIKVFSCDTNHPRC